MAHLQNEVGTKQLFGVKKSLATKCQNVADFNNHVVFFGDFYLWARKTAKSSATKKVPPNFPKDSPAKHQEKLADELL